MRLLLMAVVALLALLMVGCKSPQERAMDQMVDLMRQQERMMTEMIEMSQRMEKKMNETPK